MSYDAVLKQSVLDELKWEPSVNAAHIGVTANAGVVTLSGHVASYAEKSAAEKAAARVKDVKAVAEEIEVRLPNEIKRGDEEIATAAVHHLSWDSSIPVDAVKIKVENGWVNLSGEVEWHFQREAAARDVGGLFGVIGVTNEISLKVKPNATNIRDKILVALHRSWFNPKSISVVVQDGSVELSGTVHEWTERSIAGSTAWATPGTTYVENNIQVS
ncbi:BON domain-containing protein [Telmatospirillum siberiense]|uniref:Ornithine aminotransferase n=1 Tax=Telmatospirillum siberiense TaxID=382514 RepID=A0A2N3PRM7_9PROT|nr:BON domain-containing protein [Telmatospirillum siberiense]PKU23032.1 ornithine aminotransferase [Telmatospirillum siberiense]